MDGVSLTIARVENPDKFMVTLIPYTWDFTHFNSLLGGQSVNLEFDIIGKYVLRFMEQQKG
jgi:riboflavin synthase